MDPTALERAFALSIARLPPRVVRALAGGARPPIDGNELDAHTQFILQLEKLLGAPPAYEVPLSQARRDLDRMSSVVDVAMRWSVSTEDRVIDGPGGTISARLYRPANLVKPSPALVYFHGGGWVLGSITSHEPVCRYLAEEARCVVVSVDYRLAPEHRFPAATDDAFAAFSWAVREHARLGLDPSRVAVGGDSAGGNLAAVTAQAARDGGGPRPAFQLLVYPATDLTRSMPSHRTFAHGYFLTDETITWFRDQYAPDPSLWRDPRLSPLFAERFDDLAPALVITAGYDPLRDEGRAYADKLREAGVRVRYVCEGGLIHGFWSMGGAVPAAARALADAARGLREALGG